MPGDIPSTAYLIDEVLVQHHQINPAKVSSQTMLPARARILRNTQRVINNWWGLRDWNIKYITDSPVALPASGDGLVTLPAEFANEGQDGGVWITGSDPWRVQWRRSGEVRNWRASFPDDRGRPNVYTVSGLRTAMFYPRPDQNYSLLVSFVRSAPILSDRAESDAPDPDEDPGGIDNVPVDIVRSVLLSGTIFWECVDKGDTQALQVWQGNLGQGVENSCLNLRQGKPEVQTLPRYAGSSDVYEEP